ncbi:MULTISPECIES: TDT family transporter [Caloramator]|jgi:exfoliative toxin A/B|uniref:C4-dicarboxylate transporter/malic acid transport protein n=1 Tax=Caloramator australicus RC3 TaxID=857293 RepID=I7K5X1_9CLOT|nr:MULTISPECIES: TDT family transporter [Caloramator]MDO6354587.1 TDT family transporter [Caloramator sp. CAR-1]CCJ32929.1 C4-dicarboxylate transporter/malic acid transport protein [Caloramator australicus RC3]
MQGIIKKVPIPMAGLMLALASLGNLLAGYSDVLRGILGGISFILFLLLVIKLTLYYKDILKDLENPVVASVAPTFFMGMMILSTYVKNFNQSIAFGVWVIGLIMHAAYIVYFTKKFILNFDFKKVFVSYFVVYVGIVAASIPSPLYGMKSIGQVIFWFGFVSYIILLPLIFYRLLKIKNIPEPAIPTTAILTAPANLCLAGYLSAFDEKNKLIIYLLLMLSVIMFVAILIYLPSILKLKFYPSFSSLTFPFVITAIAMKGTNVFFGKSGVNISFFKYYVSFLEILASVMVLYVFINYISFLFGEREKQEKKITA